MCKMRLWLAAMVMLAFVGGQAQAAYRAAYWDAAYPAAWAADEEVHTYLRDALAAAGYEILDAAELKVWMDARIADGASSVVVFCKDIVPDTVAETNSADCTLRQYLDAGGKVVWYSDMPMFYQGHSDGTQTGWNEGGAANILDIPGTSWEDGTSTQVTLTPKGIEWGLTETWTSTRWTPIDDPDVFTILATDASGNAAGYVKHFVPGDTSAGFVRIWDVDVSAASRPSAEDIQRVAEYGLGPNPLASGPDPRVGSIVDQTVVMLTWRAGDFAAGVHEVYFGDSYDAVSTATPDDADVFAGRLSAEMLRVGTAGGPYPEGLVPGTTYYWRVDEVNEANPDSPWKGNVWSFMVRPLIAWNPSPVDAVKYVRLDQDVSWLPGAGVLFHTVFFGESFDQINDAVAGTWMTPEASYDPGMLEADKTYYWRIDEFTGVATHKGEVWSFTTVPEVAVTDPDLVGWWTLDEGMGTTAVDWSGQGNHGAIIADPQWADGYHGGALEFLKGGQYVDCGVPAGEEITGDFTLAAWVRLAPGNAGVYGGIAGKLTNPGMYMGFALVRHSSNVFRLWVADGDSAGINGSASSDVQYTDTNWHHIVGVREGQTNALYVDGVRQGATTITDFVPSQEWFHIGRQYSHLSDRYFFGCIDDVRVYNKALTEDEIGQVMRGDPLLAADPEPGRSELVDIRDVGSLRWTPGDTAASHNVYLGTDRESVAAAGTDSPEYQGNQPGMSLSLAGLVEFGGGDYYWRVDEVEADGATIHTGYVWTFTVPDYLIADGFDSYTDDEGSRIYETWIDGWTNGTTSTVGYEQEPFAEQNIIYSGSQSMPLDYNNVNSPYYAEAERTWATPQDWTANGVDTLTLFIRGQGSNAPAVVYVALEDSAGQVVVIGYPDDTATTATDWIRWDIALSDFAGVNAAGIKTMYLGVGDRNAPTPGGAGLVYIDDIRITKAE